MRYLGIDRVEPGQQLGRAIYSATGMILAGKGATITPAMIGTLQRIGVSMVYVVDKNFEDVVVDEVIHDETKKNFMRDMNELFGLIRNGKIWTPVKIIKNINRIIEDLQENNRMLISLMDVRTKDNEQLIHAMNVSLVSIAMGISMGLKPAQLKELAIGALLHDIGRIDGKQQDQDLKNEKGHHTWRGFEMIKNVPEFNLIIAHTALQHHERFDGRGYPRGVRGENIQLFARIVAVANTFDKLINPMLGTSLLPHEACEKMMAMSDQEFDHNVLTHFNRIISIYPNGTSVRLSNGTVGVVVQQHRGLPGRPVVRLITGEGESVSFSEIDLANVTTSFISEVLT